MRHATALCLALASMLAGCGDDGGEGPSMKPGSDCLSCHTGGDAPRFTAAGTVFTGPASTTGVAGATVVLTPQSGAPVTLTTNGVGNFYTSSPLTPPIDVSVTTGTGPTGMSGASSGACGRCHQPSGAAGGRVY
jgi:hypothetical protein